MLLNNVTLFIGYSYDDVLMNYLSRGLPKDQSKFILISEDKQNQNWDQIGLHPITYPNKKEGHKELILGLQEWNEHLSKGFLEHKEEIRKIASGTPPIDQQKADYILDRIQDEQCVKYFAKYATKSEWIKWVDEKSLLKDIFDPNLQMKQPQMIRSLAEWLADQFVLRHHKDLMELIAKYGSKISSYFLG